jgi:hypothetical protein
MQSRDAKDFLVQQTVQQAEIEGVSLSDLEKRMMCFTEGADAAEDPTQLNQEFEANFDNDEYERKISTLLHHAYKRIKNQNPEAVREWEEAVRTLRKGDHYILVLWDLEVPTDRSSHDSLYVLVSALAIIAALFAFASYEDQISRHLPDLPIPHWIALRLVILLAFVAYWGCRYLFKRLKSRQRADSEIH